MTTAAERLAAFASRARRERPVLSGLAEGCALALALAALEGLGGGALRGPAWPVLLFAAAAAARPVAFQVAMALVLGVAADALGGWPLGTSVLALAAAMAGGRLLAAEPGRWDASHALFAAGAVVAAAVAGVIAGTGLLAEATRLAWSLAVVVLASAAVAALHVAREALSRRREHAPLLSRKAAP